MKEYKFRVWSEILDKMIYSKDNAIKFYNGILLSCGDICDGKVMQYTGLKDKNGKEIYEGDIVNCMDSWEAIIEYHEYSGGWYCKNIETGNYVTICNQENMKHMKIIGNRYENPELLNE